MTHDNDLVIRAEVLELVKAVGKDWAENGQPVARLIARDLADSIDAIRSALTTEAGDGWLPIETAPTQTTVKVKAGSMTFMAVLQPGASVDFDGNTVDQWQAAIEGEHPPCWSDGACWESNAYYLASLQPTAWMPAPPAAEGDA